MVIRRLIKSKEEHNLNLDPCPVLMGDFRQKDCEQARLASSASSSLGETGSAKRVVERVLITCPERILQQWDDLRGKKREPI
jgi:hypothetical protein